jgi:hypothetical protein
MHRRVQLAPIFKIALPAIKPQIRASLVLRVIIYQMIFIVAYPAKVPSKTAPAVIIPNIALPAPQAFIWRMRHFVNLASHLQAV